MIFNLNFARHLCCGGKGW